MDSELTKRKYIRIGLSNADTEALAKAKAHAETEMGLRLSDSLFVLSIIRHAINK
jgi:hypothetical protein